MEKYQWGTATCSQCHHSYGPHVLLNGQTLHCPQCGTAQAVATRPIGVAKAERQRLAQQEALQAPHRARKKLMALLKINLIVWLIVVLIYYVLAPLS